MIDRRRKKININRVDTLRVKKKRSGKTERRKEKLILSWQGRELEFFQMGGGATRSTICLLTYTTFTGRTLPEKEEEQEKK